MTWVSPLQPEKAESPMCARPGAHGKVTWASPLQSRKADLHLPMEVRAGGNVISVSPLQSLKALSPMWVMPVGSAIDLGQPVAVVEGMVSDAGEAGWEGDLG